MKYTLYSEYVTFTKKTYTWLITLLILLPIFWFLTMSYGNLYLALEEQLNYIQETEQIMADYETEYDFSNDYLALEDILSVASPQNGINNALMVMIGIGLIFIPILSALFIGNEFSNDELIRKKVLYGITPVIIAKLLILMGYITIMVILIMGIGSFISHHHWSKNQWLLDKCITYIEIPQFSATYAIAFVAIAAFALYMLISFFISYITQNSIAGIVATIVITYGEGYITNASMPKWLCYSLIHNTVPEYDHSFAVFIVPHNLAKHGPVASSIMLILYIVIMLVVIIGVSKRK